MNKLLLLFSLLAATGLVAQPSITNSVVGSWGHNFVYVKSKNVNSFNPGNLGANVTWNFGSIDTTDGYIIQKMVKPDTTPGYSDYPSAVNRALELGSGSIKSYAYSAVTNNAFEFYGFKSLFLDRVYTNPARQLQFPFTFNNQFTDIFYDEDSTFFGNVEVIADAFGTLILPTGTFNNVLRVSTKEYYREITQRDWDGMPEDSTEYEGTYYRWYSPNVVGPVFEYSRLVSFLVYQGVRYDFDSTKHLAINKGAIITGTNEIDNTINVAVYPNPFIEKLHINSNEHLTSVSIKDALGRIVYSQTVDGKVVVLDVEHLPHGVYIVDFTTIDNKRKLVKVLKQ